MPKNVQLVIVGVVCCDFQATAMHNGTHAAVPPSVISASVTITLQSTDWKPEFDRPSYEATLTENSDVDTVVPRLSIVVTSTNLVRVVHFIEGCCRLSGIQLFQAELG